MWSVQQYINMLLPSRKITPYNVGDMWNPTTKQGRTVDIGLSAPALFVTNYPQVHFRREAERLHMTRSSSGVIPARAQNAFSLRDGETLNLSTDQSVSQGR